MATGRTEWRIDNEGISIKWTQRFAFSKRQDIYIAWKDLERIDERTDGLYKWLPAGQNGVLTMKAFPLNGHSVLPLANGRIFTSPGRILKESMNGPTVFIN